MWHNLRFILLFWQKPRAKHCTYLSKVLNQSLRTASVLNETFMPVLGISSSFTPSTKRSNKTLRWQTWSRRTKEIKAAKYPPLKALARRSLKIKLHFLAAEKLQGSNSQLNWAKCQILLAIPKTRALKTASYSLPSEQGVETKWCTSLSLRRRLQPKCNVKLTQSLLRCRSATKAKRESPSITEKWFMNEVFGVLVEYSAKEMVPFFRASKVPYFRASKEVVLQLCIVLSKNSGALGALILYIFH